MVPVQRLEVDQPHGFDVDSVPDLVRWPSSPLRPCDPRVIFGDEA